MTRLFKRIGFQLRYDLPLWLVGLLTNWLPVNRITSRLRGAVVRPFLGKCGRNLQLVRGVTFLNANGITIGDNVYIAAECWLDGIGGLTIENEVELSPYVVITTSFHCFKNDSVRFGGSRKASTKIGKGCWIAAHVVVVSGVNIGSGVIVGANAVVTKDIPDNVFAGGVPAKIIGPRTDKEPNIFSRFDRKENKMDTVK